jgi:hypothetical protein
MIDRFISIVSLVIEKQPDSVSHLRVKRTVVLHADFVLLQCFRYY